MRSWRSCQSSLREARACWQVPWCCCEQRHWAARSKWTTHKERRDTGDVTLAKRQQEISVTPEKHKSLPAPFSSAEQMCAQSLLCCSPPCERHFVWEKSGKKKKGILSHYLSAGIFLWLHRLGWCVLTYIVINTEQICIWLLSFSQHRGLPVAMLPALG